jgi:uncharacterized protein (TIGR00369 family)
MGEPTPAAEGDGLGAAIGLEYLEEGDDFVRARVAVTDITRQIHGIVHGGIHTVIAESICSRTTGIAVSGADMVAIGQSNHATFLRPITDGHIHAEAHARHRGRTTWIWDCELTDDEGRLCAIVRMTVAIRPRPRSDTGS